VAPKRADISRETGLFDLRDVGKPGHDIFRQIYFGGKSFTLKPVRLERKIYRYVLFLQPEPEPEVTDMEVTPTHPSPDE